MAAGSFFVLRPLVVGGKAFTWLSSPQWLFESAALRDMEGPMGAAAPWCRPLLVPVLGALRAAAPFRVCNAYGIFRTALDLPLGQKDAWVLEGKQDIKGSQWESFVWPTSRFQATGGFADVPGLPPWFAPHQPRADHAVFYLGIGMSMGAVSFDNTYTRALANLDAYPVIWAAALARLRPAVRDLLLRAPENISRVRWYIATCQSRRPRLDGNYSRALGAPLWKRCYMVPEEDRGQGTPEKLERRAAAFRRKAQGLFNQKLKMEWTLAVPDSSALLLPAVALVAAAGLQLRRGRCSCGGREKEE